MSSTVSRQLRTAGRVLSMYRCLSSSSTATGLTKRSQWFPISSSSNILNNKPAVRGMKTTSTIHPKPVYDEEDKVLEKVLQERENSDDLPVALTNPYEKPVRKCILCEHGIVPNYKNTKLLYQFVSPYTGNVYGRHITGLCKKMQEKVEEEAHLALNLGFMSNHVKEVEFLKDPKLCDPDRPILPHKY